MFAKIAKKKDDYKKLYEQFGGLKQALQILSDETAFVQTKRRGVRSAI